MNINELSHEFDVLASSYFREGGFNVSDSSLLAFNEYEKSVFLTREQENLVVALYSDSSAIGSFERTEQLRRDLDNLLAEDVLTPDTAEFDNIAENSQRFVLPPDLWFLVYEACRYESSANDVCREGITDFPVEVVPVTYDTLHRIKGNPFRGVSTRRALRLDNGKKELGNYVEILAKYPIDGYYVKYIRRPRPVILVDLSSSGLTISGESAASGCELHESLHRLVLDGAVRAAVNSRVSPSGEAEQS